MTSIVVARMIQNSTVSTSAQRAVGFSDSWWMDSRRGVYGLIIVGVRLSPVDLITTYCVYPLAPLQALQNLHAAVGQELVLLLRDYAENHRTSRASVLAWDQPE